MAGEVQVTAIPVLIELEGDGVRVTELAVLVEMAATGVYATSVVLLVEMEANPPPCKPSAGYTYNGVDITDYCNALDLVNATEELDAKTLGSTGRDKKIGLSNSSVRLAGDWNPTIDALLGRDALTGVRRTGVATADDCDSTVTYTWSQAFITGWKVVTRATGKIEWSATLRHNGLGTRSVSA